MEEDYGLKSIEVQSKQTKFNNFEGRPEAKDEKHMKSVEHKLLGWDKSEEEVAIDSESNSDVLDLLKEMQNKTS